MDKAKLSTWMGCIETILIQLAHGHIPRETLARATDARLDFASDADCASIKDTPPPSAGPSVSRIRKETRAETVEEIVRMLESEANIFRSASLDGGDPSCRTVANAYDTAAIMIRRRYG